MLNDIVCSMSGFKKKVTIPAASVTPELTKEPSDVFVTLTSTLFIVCPAKSVTWKLTNIPSAEPRR